MLQLALANLKTYSRRFIAVTLAVMIGTAFLAATLMVNSSATETLKNSIGSSYANADLVVGADHGADMAAGDEEKTETYMLGATSLKAIGKTSGVAAVHGVSNIGVTVHAGTRQYFASASTAAADSRLASTVLESGALPAGSDQVAVDATYAKEYNISVGDVLDVGGIDPEGKETSRHVKVTGITAASNDPMTGSAMNLTVSQTLLNSLSGPGETSYSHIILLAKDGTDLQGLKAPIAASLEATGLKYFQVKTPDEQIVDDVAAFSGGNDQLTIVLLVFALIALVVTGLVVMNTFAVLIAQRTRELALMRTLGAVRKQIRSSVLIEALVIGLLASAAGVLMATGIMAGLIKILASTVAEMSFATLAVTGQAIVLPILAGTAITLVAAWMPARKAMSVAPLAALASGRRRGGGQQGRARCASSVACCSWPPVPRHWLTGQSRATSSLPSAAGCSPSPAC